MSRTAAFRRDRWFTVASTSNSSYRRDYWKVRCSLNARFSEWRPRCNLIFLFNFEIDQIVFWAVLLVKISKIRTIIDSNCKSQCSSNKASWLLAVQHIDSINDLKCSETHAHPHTHTSATCLMWAWQVQSSKVQVQSAKLQGAKCKCRYVACGIWFLPPRGALWV